MKKQIYASMLLLSLASIPSVQAQEALQGDEKLACEALLCLAASTRPTECIPPIRRYFSISYRRFSDTLRGRLNFLNLCPVVSQPNMSSLKNAIVNGAGRCDAAAINQASYVSTWEVEPKKTRMSWSNKSARTTCLCGFGGRENKKCPSCR